MASRDIITGQFLSQLDVLYASGLERSANERFGHDF
jgi:hypothetical protein